MNKQKILISLTTITLLATVLARAPVAFAQGVTSNPGKGGNFFQGLIQLIEQKFGLNQTQVQAAVTNYKIHNKTKITPRPTLTPEQIQVREKARLDKLVTAGKITVDQETAILNELSNLQTKYNLSGLTLDQRKIQIQAKQTELKTWATNNNINMTYVSIFGKKGERRSFHNGFESKLTPTPTP